MNREYFGKVEKLQKIDMATSPIKNTYKQERDWTCSIASLRTILSSALKEVPDENYFIERYKLEPGPIYSRDICNWDILEHVEFGSSKYSPIDGNMPANMLHGLLMRGYSVMLNTMFSYDHWIVVLGIYPNGEDSIDKVQVVYYDPYYNKTCITSMEELVDVWYSGMNAVNNIIFDYVAVKKKGV